MQISDIVELMNQMSRNGISLLEHESGGERLRLERPIGPAGPAVIAASSADAPRSEEALAEAIAEPCGWIVRAPVVGVFYAAASPDDDPYVQVGSRVEVGTVLCIVEAMKLMNEVTCAWEGEVLEIYAVNGQRVEYGQPLLRIGGL
jgi:acetyl-CoA carboxylase biotin carboxyl carrier protein